MTNEYNLDLGEVVSLFSSRERAQIELDVRIDTDIYHLGRHVEFNRETGEISTSNTPRPRDLYLMMGCEFEQDYPQVVAEIERLQAFLASWRKCEA
jgi:uncharacterized protein YcsI (UPF0317 family)